MTIDNLRLCGIICAAVLLSACGGGASRDSGRGGIGGVAPPPDNPTLAGIAALYYEPAIRGNSDLRAGGEGFHIPYNGAPVVTDQYNAAAGVPAVRVQRLTYAHLGLWLMDNTFDDDGDGVNLNNDDDGLAIEYRLLADNRIRDLPAAGSATYAIEGDFIYKGERFYPDSSAYGNAFRADFGKKTLKGRISVGTINSDQARDTLGGDGAHFSSGRLTAGLIPFISIKFSSGDIAADGRFAGVAEIVPFTLGFFGDFKNGDRGVFSGAFFDAADYAPSPTNAPAEVGGVFAIADKNGETLSGGFLGSKHFGSETPADYPCSIPLC